MWWCLHFYLLLSPFPTFNIPALSRGRGGINARVWLYVSHHLASQFLCIFFLLFLLLTFLILALQVRRTRAIARSSGKLGFCLYSFNQDEYSLSCRRSRLISIIRCSFSSVTCSYSLQGCSQYKWHRIVIDAIHIITVEIYRGSTALNILLI